MPSTTHQLSCILLILGCTAIPALAADYSFVAKVRVGSVEKVIKAKIAPNHVSTIDIAPRHKLKLEVGPEQGKGTKTTMTLIRMINNQQFAVATYKKDGDSSAVRTATLVSCESSNSSRVYPTLDSPVSISCVN